jgi:hypothetical protein
LFANVFHWFPCYFSIIKLFDEVVRFLLVLSLGYPHLFGHDLVNNIAGLSVHYNRTRFGFVALIRVL